jgi:hypothetical protein
LVLKAKEGSPWAIGERVGSNARGLFPVGFTAPADRRKTVDLTNDGPPPPPPFETQSSRGTSLRNTQPDAPPPLTTQTSRSVAAASVRSLPLQQQQVVPPPLATQTSRGPLPPRADVAGPPPSLVTQSSRGPISSRNNVVPYASAAPPPSLATPAQNPISPRGSGGAAASGALSPRTIPNDFSIPAGHFQEEDPQAKPMVALAGAASTVNDGRRYEFQRDPSCVMEIDEKKRLISAKVGIRKWMLLKAAWLGETKMVQQVMREGVPIDHRDPLTGDTAIMVACQSDELPSKKKLKFIQFLVHDCGSAVSYTNNVGQSALHYCVANADTEVACYLVQQGADTLLRDDAGNVPLHMTKDQAFERELRKAEKKLKAKQDPIPPPAKILAQQQATTKPAANAGTLRQSSMASVAALLVRPMHDDAKAEMKGIQWATLRGVTDAVDVVYIFVAGTGRKALPVPIKRTTSADDVISYCCNKLQITEFHRFLSIVMINEDGKTLDVPGFKQILTAKTSYPDYRFVLWPTKGAPKDVSVRLSSLAQQSEQIEDTK